MGFACCGVLLSGVSVPLVLIGGTRRALYGILSEVAWFGLLLYLFVVLRRVQQPGSYCNE